MKRRLFLLLTVLVAWASAVMGQQDPLYTHYMYNAQVVNPAYAGSREALTVTGLARAQWMIFDKHPLTQTLTAHSPIFTQNFGMGISLSNDRIAKTFVTNGQLDFAFRFFTGKHSMLSLGLKGTATRFSEDLRGLDLKDKTDNAFAEKVRGRLVPNFGTGLYFKHDKYYFGLSVPELLENQLKGNAVTGAFSGFKQRHYYGIFGAMIDLHNRIQFKPTIMVRYTLHAPIQIDVTGSLIIRDKLIAGLMYRYQDAVGLLLGFNITEQLLVGYSFDWGVSNLQTRLNNGSHEFMLRYDFLFRDSQNTRSSRYF